MRRVADSSWFTGSGELIFFFFQAEDGIRDLVRSRGLGDVYKRQEHHRRADPPPGDGQTGHRGPDQPGGVEAGRVEPLSLIHI